MTDKTCPVCDSPLDSNGVCWTCDDDAREEKRERGAWRAYVREYKEKMTTIVTTAERVCDDQELELIGADLLEWPDSRIASHLGINELDLNTRREAVHEKIRAAIGSERIAELSRRRR